MKKRIAAVKRQLRVDASYMLRHKGTEQGCKVQQYIKEEGHKLANLYKQLRHPKKGEGATVYYYRDAHAGSIIGVYTRCNRKYVIWQRDKATLLNGPNSGEADALSVNIGGFCAHTYGIQRYSYEPDPQQGEIHKFSLRDDGTWRLVGQSTKNSPKLTLHIRAEHYDFNF